MFSLAQDARSNMAVSDQLTSIIAFAKHLRTALEDPESVPEIRKDDLDLHLPIPLFNWSQNSKEDKAQLRADAIAIWNAVEVDLQRASPNISSPIALRCKVLAHSLLASSLMRRKMRREVSIRTLTQAVSIIQQCLELEELQLASHAVSTESENQLLDDGLIDKEDDEVMCLLGTFYGLCILLGSKQKDQEQALNAYRRLKRILEYLPEDNLEACVDALANVGELYFEQDEIQTACEWLERALDALARSPHSMAFDSSELRMRILHDLVRAKMRLPGSSGLWQAYEYLDLLKSNFATKLPVLLLNLEINFSRTDVDTISAGKDLRQMIRSIHLIDTNHFIIMHHIRKLSKLALADSIEILYVYLTTRVLPESRMKCAEDGIVMFIELQITLSFENGRLSQDLDQNLTSIAHALEVGLTLGAAQAVLAVIWRFVREADFHKHASLAISWCNLGLHDLVATAGEACRAVLQRHLIALYLAREDHISAKAVLDKMPIHERGNRDTSYLEYRWSLKTGNEAESQKSLNHILSTLGGDRDLLRICIDQASKHSKPLHVMQLLQHLVDKDKSGANSDLHLGSALKYLCQTIMQALGSEETPQKMSYDLLNRLCSVFRCVSGKYQTRDHRLRNADELDFNWFATRSFEIATTHIQKWPRRYLIDLLGHGIQLHSSGGGALIELALSETEQIQYRDMLYSQTILLLAEARSVDDQYTMEDMPRTAYDNQPKPWSNNYQLVLYTKVFNTFTKITDMYQDAGLVRGRDEGSLTQLHVLLPLAFEALIFMSASEYTLEEKPFNESSVQLFLQTASQLSLPMSAWPILADIVLSFSDMSTTAVQFQDLRIPSVAAAGLLGQIISVLRQGQGSSTEQAARWIRCIVQLMLDETEQKLPKVVIDSELKCRQTLGMLESVVKQSLVLAQDTQLDAIYPPEELQWLATKLFNMALDLQNAQQNELACQWTATALDVAAAMGSVGRSFHQLLREKAYEHNMVKT